MPCRVTRPTTGLPRRGGRRRRQSGTVRVVSPSARSARCGCAAARTRRRAAAATRSRRTRSSRTRTRCRARPGRRSDQPGVDAPGVARPPLRSLPREGQHRVVPELAGVDHLFGRSHGVDEPHLELGHRAASMAQHRHQRDHPRPAADEQHRLPRHATRSRRRTGRAPRPGRPPSPRRGSTGRPRRRRGGRSSARSAPSSSGDEAIE